VIRTCIGSGCFRRPTGDLRLQLTRRTDHVEAMAPPYVVLHPHCSRGRRYVTTPVAADGAGVDVPKRFVAVTFTLRVAPTSVGWTA
jgi:hypothetical protein